MAKFTYKVDFLSHITRRSQSVKCDMVQIDPNTTKFYSNKDGGVDSSKGYDLVASFPSHIVEAVIRKDSK